MVERTDMTVDEFFATDLSKFKKYEDKFISAFDEFIDKIGVVGTKDTLEDVHRWSYSLEGYTIDVGYISEETHTEAILRFCIMSKFNKDDTFIAELKEKMDAPETVPPNVYLLYLLQYIAHRGQP